MPKNKTHPQKLLRVAVTAREAHQIRFHTQTHLREPRACVCCPRAILRALKGEKPFQCREMPWACPLGDNAPLGDP